MQDVQVTCMKRSPHEVFREANAPNGDIPRLILVNFGNGGLGKNRVGAPMLLGRYIYTLLRALRSQQGVN